MRKGVQLIYSEVAETYELVNHVLTFGFDILWRKWAAQSAAKLKGRKILDVCCGICPTLRYHYFRITIRIPLSRLYDSAILQRK